MSVEPNKTLVRRYYDEVLNGRRVELLDELAAPDYVENNPLPGQGTGREGLKQRVTMLVDGLAPTFTIADVVAEDDRVVVRWVNSGTHAGAFLGVPRTGRSFRIAGIDIHRVAGGRLAEHWHVIEEFALLQQLGLLPAPEGASA